MAPDTAGPMMKPKDQAEPMMDMPSAWNLSSLTSEIIALQAVIVPDKKKVL